jgi:hypothetical protein
LDRGFLTGLDTLPGYLFREGMLMSLSARVYRFLAAAFPLFFFLTAGTALASPSSTAAVPDTLIVPPFPRGAEGLTVTLTGFVRPYDISLGKTFTLSQTNDAPFLTGPATAGPSTNTSLILRGRPDFTQAGTYTIHWTMVDDSSNVQTATSVLTVEDLSPPTGVQAYYVPTPPGVPIANSTGVLTFVVWDGAGPEAQRYAWNGYRVHRTIHGISPLVMEVAGQYAESISTVGSGKIRIPTSPLCFAQSAPCAPDSFTFTGSGLFFRGFRSNRRVDGTYVIDYPPGSPVDACPSCWVFADLATLAGFRTDYAVTSIGAFDLNDFVETPLNLSPVVSISPGTPPADNLERVAVVPNPYKGSAQWDPAVGEGRVHFIHLPVGSHIRIFTTSAELVRELTLDQFSSPGGEIGELEWDLRNGKGNKVVSGIYVYQVETPEGRTRKGHFVIIK